MKIEDFSKEQLEAELKKRADSFGENKEEKVLVFGTLCFYPEGPSIEVFKIIEGPQDFAFLSTYSLRARFNSHRQYKFFYFKTDKGSFDHFEKTLNEKHKTFVEFILENKSVKMEDL